MQAGRATLTLWAFSLEDVAAVCPVDVATVRAAKLVDVLIVVGAWGSGIPDDHLPVSVYVARGSCWTRLYCHRFFCLHEHSGIKNRR